MTQKYFIAKAKQGQEFLYKPMTAHAVPAASAKEICEALNKARWCLSDGEVWHIFERTPYTDEHTSVTALKFSKYKGRVKEIRTF